MMRTNHPTTVLDAASALCAQLPARLAGATLFPADPRCDQARRAWNLTVDQRPAAIVMAESADDVAAAVAFARQTRLSIAVQATGHGVLRAADGALFLVTAQMRDVRVDPGARCAWVGAGAKWGLVLERAQHHGLAPRLGSAPDVGAVGTPWAAAWAGWRGSMGWPPIACATSNS